MDLSDAESRRRRGCSILFTPDSPCLMGLRPMLEGADRVTVAMWGLEQADRQTIFRALEGRHDL